MAEPAERIGTASPSGSSLTETRKREAHLALAVLGIRHLEFLDARGWVLDVHAAVGGKIAGHPRCAADLTWCTCRFSWKSIPTTAQPARFCWMRRAAPTFTRNVWDTRCGPPCFQIAWSTSTTTMQLKREALSHYRSQLAEADYAHTQFGLNAYRSSAFLGGSCRYAEAFCALSLEQYRDLHDTYMQE